MNLTRQSDHDLWYSELVERYRERAAELDGFRSSFRDRAAECTNFENHAVKAALVHVIPSAVEAACRRRALFEKRREFMTG